MSESAGSNDHRDRAHELRARWVRARAIIRAPRVSIDVYGDDETRATYRAFASRHPRFRFTASKRWGVALLQLPDTFDDYWRARKTLRKNQRSAVKAGYRYARVPPAEHFDAIVEINHSTPIRQGRPMTAVDLDWAEESFGSLPAIHGILDREGRLRAYATVVRLGDADAFSTLIGHADHLKHGIMYYLVSELVRASIDRRDRDGAPHWLMADTFWGASEGLAYFKERVGFAPHTVRWVWVDRRER